MSFWLDHVCAARKVYAIYGNAPPNLTGVDLHEIKLHRNGPRATIRFDFREFPNDPPERWKLDGNNVVQLELAMEGIIDISVTQWGTSNIVDLEIETNHDRIMLRTLDEGRSLRIEARWARIDSISSYQNNLY